MEKSLNDAERQEDKNEQKIEILKTKLENWKMKYIKTRMKQNKRKLRLLNRMPLII